MEKKAIEGIVKSNRVSAHFSFVESEMILPSNAGPVRKMIIWIGVSSND